MRRLCLLLLLLLLLLAATLAAAQLPPRPQDQAALLVQFAAAAFCDAAVIERWTCASAACRATLPDVANTTDTTFFATRRFGVNAYTAVDHAARLVVVGFRGTDNRRNVLLDVNVRLVPFVGAGVPADALVHDGFYSAWRDVEPPLVAETQRLHRLFPSYAVACTGHSMGGALAVHCAAALRLVGVNATALTFGQPRVGNQAFAQWYTTIDAQALRMTAYNDCFTRLPPVQLLYHHHPTELWTTAQGALVVCDGGNGEDPTCANSVAVRQLDCAVHYTGYFHLVFGECYLD